MKQLPQSQPRIGDSAWNDSRESVHAILARRRVRLLLRLIVFAAVSIATLFPWRLLAGHLPVEERAVLLLLMLAVGFWTLEVIPAFAVGLFIIGYLVFVLGTTILLEEAMDTAAYVDTWSSQVIWIMLGGFVLAPDDPFRRNLLVAIPLAASVGGMGTTIGSAPNAIVHSSGEVATRDFRPGGVLIGLLGPAVIIAWVLVAKSLVI